MYLVDWNIIEGTFSFLTYHLYGGKKGNQSFTPGKKISPKSERVLRMRKIFNI